MTGTASSCTRAATRFSARSSTIPAWSGSIAASGSPDLDLPLARLAGRYPFLDSRCRPPGRLAGAAMDRLTELDPARLARLQGVGILSGFAAGAWLGAAEAPTKLVTLGIPPAVISAGATALAIASPAQAPGGNPLRGVAAALAAGALWGTMYIPYRKAYLTGMHPLSFVAFFTIGEVGMMTALAVSFSGGPSPLWAELARSREVLFWLLVAGFVWVIGDLFQQYAAKYVGISRGIPLSNTNQLWGLLWGVFVFGELKGAASGVYWRAVGGSLLMAAGAGAIAFATAPGREHRRWQEAGARESARYAVDPAYVAAGMAGEDTGVTRARRSPLDWVLVATATAVFVGFAVVARVPALLVDRGWAALLTLALVGFLIAGGRALWRATRFG